ncbi:avidin-like isoform X6 [Neopsephotus bourkii]|uniref:avidin-like isoform X6 n=1 Tax=Neopsephotus bourkii TaxID=309878 RepID=UPI002AA5ABE7|nr:avidin-like isoform X6 [Neopsephotus bourkii]
MSRALRGEHPQVHPLPAAAEMVHATPFLLVLSLAMVAPVLSTGKCVLAGNWTNDLGSNMTINPLSRECNFIGYYITAVSRSGSPVNRSLLLGSQNCTNQARPVFGFTVNWNGSDSITVFTGQCFVNEEGKEVLKTMWLLRSHEDSIEDDWKATMVGTNVFTRQGS